MMKTFRSLVMALAFVAGGVAFTACESETEEANNDEYYAAYASITSSDSSFTSTSKGGTINFKASGGEVRIYVSCGTDWLVENSNSKAFTTYITDTDYLIVSAGQNLVEDEVAGTITLTTADRHIAFASITVIQNAYGAPEISVDTNEWDAPAVGRLTTSIGVSSTDEWTVECDAEWLTVEKSGTGLNLTAAENEDTEERITEIVLTCTDGYNSDSATVTVTQDGAAYITISEEALEFDSNGGEAVITVESNYEWEYAYKSDWFSIEADEEGDSLTIICNSSKVEKDREGVVTFTAGDGASNIMKVELPITQVAYIMPNIMVDTDEWHVPAVGELSTEIAVDATGEWTAESDAEWLTVEKKESVLRLTAEENTETAERTAEVTMTCNDDYNSYSEKIKVTQDALAYITLSEEELFLPQYGNEVSVAVESNFEWECADIPDWLSIEKTEDGESLRITCTINETGINRDCTITVTAGDGAENVSEAMLNITQVAHSLTVETNEWHAPAVGELSKVVEVDASADWTAETETGWLTVEKTETGITITAKENLETTERTGKIILNYTNVLNSTSETITVTQDGVAYITLSEEEFVLSQFSNTVSVAVESNFDWKCADIPNWLSIEKTGGGESLKITCTANETGVNRDCAITVTAGDGAENVSEAELNITQIAHSLIVETNEWRAPAVGELSKMIAVDASADWAAESEAAWFTVEKTESGITITAMENAETTERTGKIVLDYTNVLNSTSETITVTQDAAAYITLSEEELMFYAYEYSSTVSIEFNYDWDYTCDYDWVTVERGTNGKSVSIACSTNENVSDREAVLIFTAGDGAENIAKVELKVTQKGYDPEKSLILEYDFSSTTSLTVKLPLASVTYALINWGDGELETAFSDYPSHTYSSGGIYTVTVNGEVAHLQSGESFRSISGASYLTAVLQWGDLGLTDMSNGFYYCKKLESLPEGSASFSNVTSFSYCFYDCSSLTSAPSFEGCSAATTFTYAFYGCESLAIVPENMFSGCTSATNFSYCFYSCKELTSAPSFEGCSAVTTFNWTFYGCSVLATVPENMFSGCTSATNFSYCFRDCSSLTSAPSFRGCSAVTTFSYAFYRCSVLAIVPENMFSGCTAATNFSYCFFSCKRLTSVPSFEECSAATTFSYAFDGCESLTTVPENMFSGCTAVTDFSYCFDTCSKLTVAPSFENCRKVTSFAYAFDYCTSLTSVPENMFKGCVAVTDFSHVFYYCTSLISVPENMFSGCSAVTDFSNSFARCTSLVTVPVNIFDSCLSVLNFEYTFYVCNAVEGESPYSEITVDGETVKVHLYERENYSDYFTKPTSYSLCFGSSTFSDYSSIPFYWKFG